MLNEYIFAVYLSEKYVFDSTSVITGFPEVEGITILSIVPKYAVVSSVKCLFSYRVIFAFKSLALTSSPASTTRLSVEIEYLEIMNK